MIDSRILVAALLLVGCKRAESEHTKRVTEPSHSQPAPVGEAPPEKCEPNHEPELPEVFSCLADLGNGFTVYEWAVEHEADFVLTAQPMPPDALLSPRMMILGEAGKPIHEATGKTSVELRARMSSGRYSVVVTTESLEARHLRLSAARDATTPR